MNTASTAGTAIVCGHDIATQTIAAKKCIGYLPEGAPAYPDMTPADFLDFIAHIRGFAGAEAKRRIGSVVEMIRIAGVLHQPIETLSKGFKRRVGVAQALLHDPDLEDFSGRVSDSGEGRWTVTAAIDEGTPAPVLTAALYQRFASRGEDEFAAKVLSAMRLEFGGHA